MVNGYFLIFNLFLFFTGNKTPVIPSDNLHAAITTNVSCMECHSPARQAPLKEAHPRKDLCLDCHKVKKVKKPRLLIARNPVIMPQLPCHSINPKVVHKGQLLSFFYLPVGLFLDNSLNRTNN